MSNSNDLFAAIDLGSNSFHMLVVQNINGRPRVVAKVKRKVRLAAGLDCNNLLDDAAMERGWDCLALFAERLQNIPKQNIKVVSTATLRLATNAEKFTEKANRILGLPIVIISGEQEAELIYQGMVITSSGTGKRLIIDIGGASTELILGHGATPLVLNSLNMGCVTWLERYFCNGALSKSNFERAIEGAATVLSAVRAQYLDHQWQLSLGASGSVQAVQEVLQAQGLNETITLEKLELLITQTVACNHINHLDIEGLKEQRKPVFASGLAILTMLFKELSLESMVASGGALREGLIAILLQQAPDNQLKLTSIDHLQQQYQVDCEQAAAVTNVAKALVKQVCQDWPVMDNGSDELLYYSAQLHEIGLSINYLKSNDHGAYLLSHCPMPGFSIEQQKLISVLVANYKNPIEHNHFAQQAWCEPQLAFNLTVLLRLAVIIAGRYQAQRSGDISLSVVDNVLCIEVAKTVAMTNPLLMAELTQEAADHDQVALIIK